MEGGRNTKILIVEDNEGLASVLQEMLEAEGFEIRSASDGRDGYLTYLTFEPDLVITDLLMPGESGLEFIRNIRIHDPEVKVIYMSGDIHPFWKLLEEEIAKYHVACLEKPFSKVDLMKLLSVSLR